MRISDWSSDVCSSDLMVAQGPDGEVAIAARHVISSAPMRELAGRIRPLPATLGQAMDLKYRDFLTVALMVKGEDIFPDNWIYIHDRSEEHTSELQSLMRISYAVFCLKKKKTNNKQ